MAVFVCVCVVVVHLYSWNSLTTNSTTYNSADNVNFMLRDFRLESKACWRVRSQQWNETRPYQCKYSSEGVCAPAQSRVIYSDSTNARHCTKTFAPSPLQNPNHTLYTSFTHNHRPPPTLLQTMCRSFIEERSAWEKYTYIYIIVLICTTIYPKNIGLYQKKCRIFYRNNFILRLP